MKESNQTSGPDTAAELTSLAAWIDEQLGDETADRQWIAESAAAKVRDTTLQMLVAEALGRRADPELEHDETGRRWLLTRLLNSLPVPAQPGDGNHAVAEVLAEMPGDVALIVTRWLRAAAAGQDVTR